MHGAHALVHPLRRLVTRGPVGMQRRLLVAAGIGLAVTGCWAAGGARAGPRPVPYVTVGVANGSIAFARSGGRMHVISRPGLKICCADPALSPDGRRVAYASAVRQGHSALYVASLGARPHVVARIPGRVYRVLWSPDGLRIAVPTSDSDTRISVVTVRTRRRRLVRLAARTRFTILEGWSPDSKELLVVATVPTGTFLAAIAISNARRREISAVFPYGYSGSPEASWSPDGSSIAFTDDCQDVCESLKVVSAHGGQPRNLKVVGGSVHAPVWASPPGTLAYIDEVGASNNEAVYLVNTRTGRRRRLSPQYGAVSLDSLTPLADRSRIAAIYTLHGTRVDIIDIASDTIRHSRIPHACCIQIAGPAP